MWSDQGQRMEWNKEEGETRQDEKRIRKEKFLDVDVIIEPMEIRTFILKVVYL